MIPLAVVGAGAAGLMTAISAARAGAPGPIVLLDSRSKVGAKILISGGTRCNVTNRRVQPSDYSGASSHFVRHVLEAFTPDQTLSFFESIGVPLVLESTGKYFPTTHSGRTVLEALLNEASRLGVKLETGARVTSIERAGEDLKLYLEGFEPVVARRVALCTGGLSYPETGSDGTGLRLAQSLGHTVAATAPALTPLTGDDEEWKALSGVAAHARLSFYLKDRKQAEAEGPLLFTHFGFSGPCALDLSRHVAYALQNKEPMHVEACFFTTETEATLKAKLILSPPVAFLKRSGIPERLAEALLRRSGLSPERLARTLSAEASGQLAHFLMHCPLPVSGVYGYRKAEVTAGGVDLRELRIATMESKRVPGLYFAGEILNIDGRIGGFNFQWAWSTGAIAGRSAAKSLRP